MNDIETTLLRSEKRFLRGHNVRRVLETLTKADSLTIYCGAGVSINRTGLTWPKLIKRLADYFYAQHERGRLTPPDPEEVEVLLNALGPEGTATIMHGLHVDTAGKGWPDFQQKIGARLAQDLYSGNSWEEGRLARSITNLARGLAHQGKKVSIITTNYDYFLEERWILDRESLPDTTPNLKVYVLNKDGTYQLLKNRPGEETAPGSAGVSVDLTYLHGRVSPSDSLGNSALVISEHDYAKYRSSIESRLQERFNDDESLLIVGSSLSDGPLVHSLIRTATEKASSQRVCVMPIESYQFSNNYDIEHQRYINHLEARARSLGLSLQLADFKCQVAQLVEEVTLSLVAQARGTKYKPIRYGNRLVNWWEEWSKSSLAQDHQKLQRKLSELLEATLDLVDKQGERHDSGEHFKLELWVRRNPVLNRELVLWATSQAVLTDREFLNSQEIERSSKISSVVALTEGRAIHKDTSEIRGETPGGIVRRWNSYFSVPVYIRSAYNSRLPVGVLTIASSAPANKSILPPRDEKKADLMLHAMIGTARDWLKTPSSLRE
ncbi:hypothetical protein EII35_05440 [Arachnia propionica]|uniref:Uncharacterized protein n=1 Tax=Arachnia propionica TaxID=1750 RepID=A0A3P1WVX3_9ACTN|nr:hypothetical protein EII35_05440 [Arachnia propionica]